LTCKTVSSGGSSGAAASTGLVNEPPPELNARLPVFLELKQLTVAAFQQAQGQLEELLFAQAIAARLKPNDAERDALKQHFHELLRAGRVAVFLDGLDEVSGASFFRDLQTATQAFLQSVYGGNTVIISTRPFALPRFADAKEMEILPLNPRQIEQFIAYDFCRDERRFDDVYILDGRTDRGRWLRLVFQDKGNGLARIFTGWDLQPQKGKR
jgi:hypothetical protein